MKKIILGYLILISFNDAKAQSIIDSLKIVINQTEQTQENLIKIYSDLCFEYRNVSQDSAMAWGRLAVQESRKINNSKLLASSLNDLSIIFIDQNKFDSALLLLNESLELRTSLKDSLGMGAVYNKIGIVHQYRKELQKSAEASYKALDIYEKFKIEPYILYCLHNIAVLHWQLRNFEKSLETHQKILAIRTKNNDPLAGSNHLEIANNYVALHDTIRAIEYFEKSINLLRVINSPDLSVCLNNYGSLELSMGRMKEAEIHLEEALSLRRKSQSPQEIASSLILLSKIHIHRGNKKIAYDYINESIALSKAGRFPEEMVHALEVKLLYFSKYPNFDSAQYYLNRYNALKTEMYDEALNSDLTELQTKYETEKKDNEIKALKTESELKELQIAQTQTLVVTISVIAILVVILIIFYSRQRRLKLLAQMAQEKEQLQKDRFRVVIDTEEKERMRVARELHDGLGQMLSTVRLFVSDMADTDENPKVERSLKALDSTIDEVRNISHNMMPIKLMELGLPAALEDMAKRVNESSKLDMVVENAALLSFGETESIALYRTIQEVINNAIKYAKANVIKVQVVEAGDSLSITIKDDGQGFNTENIAKSKGIGWSNIYARMELIGADVKVISKSAEGTQVILNLPQKSTEIRSAKAS